MYTHSTVMPGLNPQYDVEIVELPDVPGYVDLIPLTNDGVQALSEYLKRELALGAPVRVTDEQNSGFHAYTREYVEKHKRGFSTTARRRFLGQRQLTTQEVDALWKDAATPDAVHSRVVCDDTFLVLKEHNFTVGLMRYGSPASGPLYKVTKPKHTPPRSLSVSLGTLEHYRNTVDKDEAAFTIDDPPVTTLHVEGKGSVQAQMLGARIDPCWIYCTTILGGEDFDQTEWRGRDATPIVCSADHFAYMLGAAFGVWSKSRVREVYAWAESVEVLRGTMNAIMVMHGPVRYMDRDERNEYLRSLARTRSALEMPEHVFTKSNEFAWEREYRFGIFGWGPPLKDHVILPMYEELLDCYGRPVLIP